MSVDTKKYSDVMHEALEMADGITPSVLAIAQELGIKPKALAAALVGDSVALYRTKVALEVQAALVEKAVADEKEAAEKNGD